MRDKGLPMTARVIQLAFDIANGRHFLSKAVPLLLLAMDALLCAVIIWKVPYTEIDWKAYMEQVQQFVEGERDYTKMEGGTGPLVYPAAHVYTYTALYYVTDRGKDILMAQQIFAGVYLLTLAVVMACYAKAKAPPYIYPLLILSKRLHSIYMLRCFNDCFAALFLWIAIFFFQRRQYTLGVLAYTWGLGTKMSLLLGLPAVGVVLLLRIGFKDSLKLAFLMAQVQFAIAVPFLATNPWGYLSRAFELSRQFLFKWTVNWRFVGEEVFLSRWFALALLVLHVGVLYAFMTRIWLLPAQKPWTEMLVSMLKGESPFGEAEQRIVARRVDPKFVMATILEANAIGFLFARSLHYQFYAYIAWATPFLLWRSAFGTSIIFMGWGLQEWAWNQFPSTVTSSAIVVHMLVVTLVASWASPDAESVTGPVPLVPPPARIEEPAKKSD